MDMTVSNRHISEILGRTADLLEIDGANPFRVRAYRSAARTVDDLGEEVAGMLEAGRDLTTLPGVGGDLAEKLRQIVAEGRLSALDDLHRAIPETIHDLLALPGLGPKKVRVLYRELGVASLEALREGAQAGRVRALPGMGKKTEEKLLAALEARLDASRRFLRAAVVPHVERIVGRLRDTDPDAEVTVAGSYRRSRETVGDVDVLAAGPRAAALMDVLVKDGDVGEVLAHGPAKSSVVLRDGLQVDLRVVDEHCRGAALHYFTGSKAHVVAMRRRAQQRGLRLNEYGLFDGDECVARATEEDVFSALGLPFVPPELREDRGELPAAEDQDLPRLVSAGDIRGDLHTHSTASDGVHTIRQMAEAARQSGYEYMAVTDHSKRLVIANGLDEDRLRAQIEEIDGLNEAFQGLRILKGVEVDILEDGSLDLADDVLAQLDVVIGSIHSKFRLGRDAQTERVLRAMDHPCFTLLGHPTGRKLLSRDPMDIDMERVIAHARERGCFLELNANPLRLDLNDVYCRMARDAGVRLCVNTDAHRMRDFDNIVHGVGQARRGWLESRDIINTRSLAELLPMLRGTRR